MRMSFFCSNTVSQLFLLNECIFETKNLNPFTHEKWTHVHTNRRGIHFILWLSFCIMRICLFYSFFIVFLSFCLSVFMCLCNSGIKFSCIFVSLCFCLCMFLFLYMCVCGWCAFMSLCVHVFVSVCLRVCVSERKCVVFITFLR